MKLPNERMQLTWLLGAPSRPGSVHRRVDGRVGLGSPATQLMRAVGQPLRDKVGVSLWIQISFARTGIHSPTLLQ